MEKNKVIYMDKDSYNRSLNDINKLIIEKRIVDLKKSEVHKKGTDVSWDNAEFFELERTSEMLGVEIQRRQSILESAVIVENQNRDDVVEFGDILRLSIFDQYGQDEIIGKLVGDAKYDKNSEYLEISCNGVIGTLIYGKKIGQKIGYVSDGVNCSVQIMEKLNSKKNDEKGALKKLVKE